MDKTIANNQPSRDLKGITGAISCKSPTSRPDPAQLKQARFMQWSSQGQYVIFLPDWKHRIGRIDEGALGTTEPTGNVRMGATTKTTNLHGRQPRSDRRVVRYWRQIESGRHYVKQEYRRDGRMRDNSPLFSSSRPRSTGNDPINPAVR